MPDRNSPTTDLEDAVEEFYNNFPYPGFGDFGIGFAEEFDLHCIKKFKRAPPEQLADAIGVAAMLMFSAEAPDPTFTREIHTDPIDHARYRDTLLGLLKFKHSHD